MKIKNTEREQCQQSRAEGSRRSLSRLTVDGSQLLTQQRAAHPQGEDARRQAAGGRRETQLLRSQRRAEEAMRRHARRHLLRGHFNHDGGAGHKVHARHGWRRGGG